MIVLIPLGGIGERFKKLEYIKPKALIEVCGKCIIFHLLDNLNLEKIEYVLIPYNKEYINFNLEELVTRRYPNTTFKFLKLEENTRGAAETINLALNYVNERQDKPVLCIDSDSFYLSDIITDWNGENAVFTFKDTTEKPIFSYVKCELLHKVIKTVFLGFDNFLAMLAAIVDVPVPPFLLCINIC